MRYAATHKEETREKLIESSRALAKKGGFETTGVDALMKAIGLTGGAFCTATSGRRTNCSPPSSSASWSTAPTCSPARRIRAPTTWRECLRGYLSTKHAAQPESGCALPALARRSRARSRKCARASNVRSGSCNAAGPSASMATATPRGP